MQISVRALVTPFHGLLFGGFFILAVFGLFVELKGRLGNSVAQGAMNVRYKLKHDPAPTGPGAAVGSTRREWPRWRSYLVGRNRDLRPRRSPRPLAYLLSTVWFLVGGDHDRDFGVARVLGGVVKALAKEKRQSLEDERFGVLFIGLRPAPDVSAVC
jgi:hypothetical protein